MNADILLKYFDRISEAPDAIPRLRRFILDLAVRGKLVVQDPQDEPASKLLKRIQVEKTRLVKDESIRKQLVLDPVSADEQPFEICKAWNWVRFGAIADFSAGRTPSRHDTTFWNTGDYPWVSIADMTTGETIFATKETVSEKAKKKVFSSERGCKKLCVNGHRRLQPVTTGGTDGHTERRARLPDEGLQKS